MLSTKDLYNTKIFRSNRKGRLKKYGNLRSAIFYPNKLQLVGFIVKRPDLLWLFKRSDRFLAVDSLGFEGDAIVVDPSNGDAWDKGACKRLELDYDNCLIWDGMPVVNAKGESLGTISDVVLDPKTRKIDHIDISESSINRALLGSADIPAEDLVGYKDGAIVADITKTEIDVNGGVAAKAGEAWAKGSNAAVEAGKKAASKTTEVVEKAVDKTADAITDGAYNAGKLIGKAKASIKASAAAGEASAPVKKSSSGASTAAKKSSSSATSAKKKSSSKSASASAAKALNKQANTWKKAFSDMKKEYDKASKGE